jgi:hypothetical protein
VVKSLYKAQRSREQHVLVISCHVATGAELGLEEDHLSAEVEGIVEVNEVKAVHPQQAGQEGGVAKAEGHRQTADGYLPWVDRITGGEVSSKDRDLMT